MTHQIRIAIRWSDVDAYQHVNNAIYLNYLEEARDRLVEDLFGSHEAWDFVLAHVEIDFRSELKQSDGEVIVTCEVASLGWASVRTREQIRKLDGTLAAEAQSVVVPLDREMKKARPLTEDERKILSAELEGA